MPRRHLLLQVSLLEGDVGAVGEQHAEEDRERHVRQAALRSPSLFDFALPLPDDAHAAGHSALRANLRAPDSMTVTLSDAGPGGPFGGSVVETGFDDSPEGNAAAGVGPGDEVVTTPMTFVATASSASPTHCAKRSPGVTDRSCSSSTKSMCSSAGRARTTWPQAGHSKSANSMIFTGASGLPRVYPRAAPDGVPPATASVATGRPSRGSIAPRPWTPWRAGRPRIPGRASFAGEHLARVAVVVRRRPPRVRLVRRGALGDEREHVEERHPDQPEPDRRRRADDDPQEELSGEPADATLRRGVTRRRCRRPRRC